MEHIAVLNGATRLGPDYLNLHLGLELNTNSMQTITCMDGATRILQPICRKKADSNMPVYFHCQQP